MKVIKLSDRQFESLLDLINNDFKQEYERQKESEEHDSSFMKEDLSLFQACFADSLGNDTVNYQTQVIEAKWKGMIKEIDSL